MVALQRVYSSTNEVALNLYYKVMVIMIMVACCCWAYSEWHYSAPYTGHVNVIFHLSFLVVQSIAGWSPSSRTCYCHFPGCGKGNIGGTRAPTRIILWDFSAFCGHSPEKVYPQWSTETNLWP